MKAIALVQQVVGAPLQGTEAVDSHYSAAHTQHTPLSYQITTAMVPPGEQPAHGASQEQQKQLISSFKGVTQENVTEKVTLSQQQEEPQLMETSSARTIERPLGTGQQYTAPKQFPPFCQVQDKHAKDAETAPVQPTPCFFEPPSALTTFGIAMATVTTTGLVTADSMATTSTIQLDEPDQPAIAGTATEDLDTDMTSGTCAEVQGSSQVMRAVEGASKAHCGDAEFQGHDACMVSAHSSGMGSDCIVDHGALGTKTELDVTDVVHAGDLHAVGMHGLRPGLKPAAFAYTHHPWFKRKGFRLRAMAAAHRRCLQRSHADDV